MCQPAELKGTDKLTGKSVLLESIQLTTICLSSVHWFVTVISYRVQQGE
jgi:hypothetical protein